MAVDPICCRATSSRLMARWSHLPNVVRPHQRAMPNGWAVTIAQVEVLVTGGAGYIGSTVATALEAAGHTPVILDSLLNGRLEFVGPRAFYEADMSDRSVLARIREEHPDVACTIHCAARIIVSESVREPYAYYRDNVAKSLELFNNLVELGIPRIVFSSSASLYATVPGFEVREDSPLEPASPYARTKRVMEMALEDMSAATNLRAIVLRYFNPIGSDPDLSSGIYDALPSHVLGQLVAAARGDIEAFTITGVDHPTRDGSGIRDYIHVWDLARAHVLAIEKFDAVLQQVNSPSTIINCGSGRGVTVKELVAAFERVCGTSIPKREAPPRPGDAVGAYANADKAEDLLGWHTELGLDEAIDSALAWGRQRHAVLGIA